LAHRRVRLESVVAGSELVFPVRRLAPDGLAAWKQVVERGYEGYVAKDDSASAFAVVVSPFEHAASASFTRLKALLLPAFAPERDRGAVAARPQHDLSK